MPDQSNHPDPVAADKHAPAAISDSILTSNTPAKHSLTYALDSLQVQKRARRRKQFFIAGLLALVISGYWWVPATYRRVNYQIGLYQCRSHEFAPGLVVVDKSDPKAPVFGPRASSLNRLFPGPPSATTMTTVYMHQRRDGVASGLVIISVAPVFFNMPPGYTGDKPLALYPNLLEHDPPLQPYPRWGSAIVLDEDVTKVYAGQTDPKDPSHFTIDYLVDGQLQTIDGYLRRGEIVLEPRNTYELPPVPADPSSAPATQP